MISSAVHADGRYPDPRPQASLGSPRVLVVGAGSHFLSGMSHYTVRVTNALASRFETAAVPMRRLLPRAFYPGRSRVGRMTTWVEYSKTVVVLPSVDWYWIPSLVLAARSILKWRPQVVVFQWWTGTVAHTYLVIALIARLIGARVVVEFHEIQDTGEERVPLAKHWVAAIGRIYFRLAAAFVIHSDADRGPLHARYGLLSTPCAVIPHGPLDHFSQRSEYRTASVQAIREAPTDAINLLFFGVIRPFKGLEDLVRAFDLLSPTEVKDYWLTVVGETWEGWDLPVQLIEQSRYRSRITLVNRFVSDDDVVSHFAGADAVVLPYHRSSASAPAHVTMSNGLPLIITEVGGLPAAVGAYEGAILVPPKNPEQIRDAIRRLPPLRGQRFSDPHSWEHTVNQFSELFDEIRRSA